MQLIQQFYSLILNGSFTVGLGDKNRLVFIMQAIRNKIIDP